nr:protein LTO1 homolog isoform X3 [Equus asinus]
MAGSQDMFDAIVMADERFHGEGYQEGYEEGSTLGIIEGRQHGTLHGAKIGSEIGCYQGFAFAWRCLLHNCAAEKDRRARRGASSEPPSSLTPKRAGSWKSVVLFAEGPTQGLPASPQSRVP